MERLHLHTIQQLQLELVNARDSQTNSKEISQFAQNNGGQQDASGSVALNGNPGGLPNGNAENILSFTSPGNASIQVDCTF